MLQKDFTSPAWLGLLNAVQDKQRFIYMYMYMYSIDRFILYLFHKVPTADGRHVSWYSEIECPVARLRVGVNTRKPQSAAEYVECIHVVIQVHLHTLYACMYIHCICKSLVIHGWY